VKKKALIFGIKQYWDKAYLPPIIFAEYLVKQGYDVNYVADDISIFHLKKWKLSLNLLCQIKETIFNGIKDNNITYYSGFIFIPEFIVNSLYLFVYKNFNFQFKSKKVKKILNDKYDIIWSSSYRNIDLFNQSTSNIKLFSIEDNIRGFNIIPENKISYVEKIILNTDNIKILCTSLALIHEKYTNAIYYSNGINQNFKILPFKNSNNKKCVYIGALEDWFDWELINNTFEKLSKDGYTLDIYGFSNNDISKLIKTNNIKFKGSIDNTKVQSILTKYDIGIIPFKVTDLIEYVNPIKLYEYLASGLKVISINWKELKYINPNCTILSTRDDFQNNLVLLNNQEYSLNSISQMQDVLKLKEYNSIFDNVMSQIEK